MLYPEHHAYARSLSCSSSRRPRPRSNAGTYVGLGVGTGPSVSDSVNTPYLANGRSLRLILGYRFGNISIEGSYTGYTTDESDTASASQFDSRTLALAAKLNYPLGNNFEVFGRGGLLQTELDPADSSATSTTGTGYTLSAGFEYRLNLLVANGSIFVDYTRNQATFDSGTTTSYDQTASMWMLGVTLSL